MAQAPAPGWYGKLPTLGDFASRRLPAEFIEPWDLWLGHGLAAQRETLGNDWLDAYLHSPVWRFVLMPGVLPGLPADTAMAGVLMPSVDRVGRYFPLTLVAPLPSAPRDAGEVEALLAALHRLEDVALDALQDDWSVDELEQVLTGQGIEFVSAAVAPEHLAPAFAELAAALGGEGGFVDLDGVHSRSELAQLCAHTLAHAGDSAWPRSLAGRAFWLADHPTAARLLVSRGLPSHTHFVQMLGAAARDPGATTIF